MVNILNYLFPGALSQGQQIPAQQPVLASPRPYTPPVSPAQLSKYTANARNSYNMPPIPNNQIDMMSEGLIRMGGAGLGTAEDGPLAQWSAMTGAYGDIKDYNRAREMEQYQAEEARMLEEQRRQDLLRKLNSGGAAGSNSGDPEAIGDVRMGIAKLRSARDMFTQDHDSSLTGFNFSAALSRLTGRFIGNEDEAARLFLQEVRLDSVMQRVAQTKGAISNAEMQLFASQAPSIDSNGVVWKAWIDRQVKLQQKILNRLQNGIQVDQDAPLDADLADPNTGTVDQSVIDEANAVINGDDG
jgi:hypothetical protein